jgi:hypothetical protein
VTGPVSAIVRKANDQRAADASGSATMRIEYEF